MVSRRVLIASMLSIFYPICSIARNNRSTRDLGRAKSALDFSKLLHIRYGDLLYLDSYHLDKNLGGGFFKITINNGQFIDNGIFFKSSETRFLWERITHGNFVKPEWYGAVGDGVSDDGPYFASMLNSLTDGVNILLSKNAIYFNKLSDEGSKWILKNNNIKIFSDNSTLKRRSTYPNNREFSYGNLATLKISGNYIELVGVIFIDGGEGKFNAVDKNNKKISESLFVRSSGSTHALFIENSSRVFVKGSLHCFNAVFPCYVHNSKKISLQGSFVNSGQVYPVTGDDLQLGSCIKISESNQITISGICENSVYSGCEIEPTSSDVTVKIKVNNCLFYGVIIHDHSNNIKLNAVCNNIKNSGVRVSDGSYNVQGNVHVTNSDHAIVVSSFGSNVCHDIKLDVYAKNIYGDVVQSFNTNPSDCDLINSEIKIYVPDT